MSNTRLYWYLNMLGPGWFRRLRTAWGWYRSGDMMITEKDVQFLLENQRKRIVHIVREELARTPPQGQGEKQT